MATTHITTAVLCVAIDMPLHLLVGREAGLPCDYMNDIID